MDDNRTRADVELLVVGGGPAALSAATAYRDSGGSGRVLLVSEEGVLPYSRPPLSKDYLRGEAGEEGLILESAATLADRGVECRLGVAVEVLTADGRVAVLADHSRVSYRQCILATGASPSVLPIPGADSAAVLTLRSLASARDLRTVAHEVSAVLVIGSGFVGCEAAASLARLGLAVTVVSDEGAPLLARLGSEVSERIAGWLREEGVELIAGAEVSGIEEGDSPGSGVRVLLGNRDILAAELVLMATGTRPNAALADAVGARMEQGRVKVDDQMRASVPGLLAAGDVACAHNAGAGRHLVVEHWGEALEMGRVAGVTAAGGIARWDQAPGFWSTVGDRDLKYVAWGDGFDVVSFQGHQGGGFTAWYGHEDVVVGVATHDADGDYERGRELVESAAPFDAVH